MPDATTVWLFRGADTIVASTISLASRCWLKSTNSENIGSINLRAETNRLHLSYRVNIGGSGWDDVTETVRIAIFCHMIAI